MLLGLELTIPQIVDPTFCPIKIKKKKKTILWILHNKKNKQNKIQMHIKDIQQKKNAH